MGNKFIAERADFFGGFVVKQTGHSFGKIAHHTVGHRESGGENHARFVNHFSRQTPAVRQVTARRGRFVIKHQRDTRILQGQDTSGNGQLETAVHRADPFGGQAEFFFQVKRATLGRQFNGLHRGGQAFKTVVAVFGFDNKFNVFINLFLLDFRRNGFNHIAAGKNFVQHAFAEDFIPTAGTASSNTADYNGFFTVVRGGRGNFARAGFGGFGGAFGFFNRGGIAGYPVYKSRVKGMVITVHISTSPIQMNTRGN